MNTATATITEEKRDPIQKEPQKEQLKVTGQWLYENFVTPDETQVTRMQMLAQLVDAGVDAFQLKGACDKMVEIAKSQDVANGVPAKVTDPETGKEKPNRGPKCQQAMNTRTVLQNAWGAIKFAKPQLEHLGYTPRTGYNAIQVLAKRALEEAGVDWKGHGLPTPEEIERKRLARAQKAESGALAQAFHDNPRLPGEDDASWTARALGAAHDMIETARQRQEGELVQAVVDGITKAHGAEKDRVLRVAQALFDWYAVQYGVDVSYTTAQPEEETQQATQSEETPAHA